MSEHPAGRDSENTTEKSIELSVVRTIDKSGMQDTLAHLAEAGLDQILDEGFLRDVPVLGTILGVIRATRSVRDLLLAKKLGRFLLALQTVPLKDREDFRQSLSSREEEIKVGETLILLLDRLDDLEKPQLVARVFGAFLRGEIDQTTFRLMASAIDRLHLPHLRALTRFYAIGGSDSTDRPDPDTCQALAYAGLVRVEARGNGGAWFAAEMAGAVLAYSRNELGRQFVSIITREA